DTHKSEIAHRQPDLG
nr:RecName: Full=Unknown protein NF041 from 2D-PAGE [Naegleria fowleri]